jgi:DNA primase
MSDVEDIKQRLDIAEVIGTYMPLTRAGTASSKARCPFHQEKTPSFYISRDRQMWHCFGCGEGGDVFSFVMKIEGIDFREALRLLAAKAGVTLKNSAPEEASDRRRLFDLLALSVRFYRALLDAPQGATARAYLVRRGISQSMIDAFGLGYAPEAWGALARTMAKRGVATRDLERVGMVIKRERGSGVYDRFRNRLLFPIRDVHGQVIGFTGRVLDPDTKEAKYVNTPQTELYNKSAALYGIDRARGAIRSTDLAVIVEGNVDVISSHQIGMENVVAASGTALTGEQLHLLARFSKNIAIAFDADAAGAQAARKGMELALREGFTVRIICIPKEGGKDPDECIQKDPELWRRAVAAAVPVMEYLLQTLPNGRSMDDATVKKEVGNELLRMLLFFPDPIERDHWLQRIASLLAMPEAILREQLQTLAKKTSATIQPEATVSAPQAASPIAPVGRHRLLSESFLALLSAHPSLFSEAVERVPSAALVGGELQTLYNAAIVRYTAGIQFSTATGAAKPPSSPPGDLFSAVIPGNNEESDVMPKIQRALLLRGENEYAPLSKKEAENEFRLLSVQLRESWASERREQLARDMRAAEQRGDTAAVAAIEREMQEMLLAIRGGR